MQNRQPKYTSKQLVEQTEVFQVWVYTYEDRRVLYVVPRNTNDKTVVVSLSHMWKPIELSNGIRSTISQIEAKKRKKS